MLRSLTLGPLPCTSVSTGLIIFSRYQPELGFSFRSQSDVAITASLGEVHGLMTGHCTIPYLS